MSVLYHSASGHDVCNASDSSLGTYRFCRRKFKLQRIDGWKEKARKASLEFGKAIEAAIQFYYTNGCEKDDAQTEFKRVWLKFENVDLAYTDAEGDWKSLYTCGSELMALFEIISSDLPIKNPKWQLEFQKQLWPGSNLGDLGFIGYIDCLSTADDGERMIVDIKTARSLLDVTPNMLSMDGQLRKYAWLSGIRRVGFLNLVKGKADSLKKNDVVTIVDNSWCGELGEQLTVLKFDSESQTLLGGTAENVQLMDTELAEIKGRGSTEAKEKRVASALADQVLFSVPRAAVTKCRIQFLTAEIPAEEIPNVGDQIGRDVLAVKKAYEDNFFPQDGGVRFPNQICTWCSYRGICLKNDKLRDELLVQIKPSVAEPIDWLKELEDEVE